MYADYLTERTTDEIIESNEGFATFRYVGDKSVYIVDIYVKPESRKTGHAAFLANEICLIAKRNGKSEIMGTVVPSAKGSTTSLKVLLAYGFALWSSTNDLIIFRKDL